MKTGTVVWDTPPLPPFVVRVAVKIEQVDSSIPETVFTLDCGHQERRYSVRQDWRRPWVRCYQCEPVPSWLQAKVEARRSGK